MKLVSPNTIDNSIPNILGQWWRILNLFFLNIFVNTAGAIYIFTQLFFPPSTNSPDPGDGSGPGLRMGYSASGDYGYVMANSTGVTNKTLRLNQNGGQSRFGGKVTIDLAGVSVFANNAAAVAGGLTQGDIYRLGGDPDQLCIVH